MALMMNPRMFCIGPTARSMPVWGSAVWGESCPGHSAQSITRQVMEHWPAGAISSLPMNTTRPVGDLLRAWRQRRRMSQLDFAVEAEISSKHLSFLETGRSRPSRDMLLKLSELLEVPLRERNTLLIAAGFAPMFSERKLDDPSLQAARDA